MNFKKSVTHHKKRYFLPISFIFLLILPLSIKALAMDWHVYWTPEEITENLTTGETIEKNISFTLEGKSNINTKITTTPNLQPFVTVDPEFINLNSLDIVYSFRILLSIPEDATPGIYEGALRLNRWKNTKQGWQEIPSQIEIKFTVNEANAPPVITGQSPDLLNTLEETALTISLTDLIVTDSDNTFPDDFTLSVQDGDNYSRIDNTITPLQDFNGPLMVPVKVNDGEADSNIFNLTVSVGAINDAPTVQDAIFTVPEDAPNGTSAGSVLAFDPDDPLYFTITGGNDDGIFKINSSSGKITVFDNSHLDYETRSSYSLSVQVTDSGGLTDTAIITINVSDVYEDLISSNPSNNCPTRIAQGPNGNFFVTDALAGSIFIYDSNFNLTGNLNGFDKPLGLAVDSEGNIFVGNNGRDNVEIYNASGSLISTIRGIQMPNDIVMDNDGNLYVVDSPSHRVKVYDSSGQWLRNIGGPVDADGELNFPVAAAIHYNEQGSGEIYVADQGHAKIQVFDLLGNFIASFGGKIEAFSSDWQGKFAKIQSLAFDVQGRLHAADCYLNKVQILNPATGQYLDAYGTFGTDTGQLNLPLDIFITSSGQVAVANAGNRKVEIIYTIP